MSKLNKLERFAEMKSMPNVVQFGFHDMEESYHQLRGKWKSEFFKNENPLVLELGCGKGEYTVGLSRRFPNQNFVGIDIKGARMHRGASIAIKEKLTNAGFVRTRIDFVNAVFGPQEVNEIWITFPDPQKEKPRKRLTSPGFLARYAHLLAPDGIIHLKTDSALLHEYTKEMVQQEKLELIDASSNIYGDGKPRAEWLTNIQTYYEGLFREKGVAITYISFRLPEGYAKDVKVFPLDYEL
jgi:tRNA (guanine-N7-)-methyltransferase